MGIFSQEEIVNYISIMKSSWHLCIYIIKQKMSVSSVDGVTSAINFVSISKLLSF